MLLQGHGIHPQQSKAFDYSDYLHARSRRGNFFSVFRSWLPALTAVEAMVVGHLLNVGKSKTTSNGWIMATKPFLRDGLGLSADDQQAVIDSLGDKGILEVVFKGEPARRHLRINLERLEQLIANGA
jgi:hypothetical protein